MINEVYENLYGGTIFEIEARNQAALLDSNTIALRITKNDSSVHYVFIDIEDYVKCKDFYWYAVADHNTFYAMANMLCSDGRYHMVKMHRFLMFEDVITADKNIMIDHINRNGLDNRRSNIRFIDNRKNQWNAKLTAQNTAGINGVSYSKTNDTFYASIRIENGKRLYKSYSVRKYGYDNAINMAKQQRLEWESLYRY